MKKFFKKASSLTRPASYFATKFGKKKHSVKDDFEEVSDLPDLPDLDVMFNGSVEENVIEQAGAPVDDSLVDSHKKVEIFEKGHQSHTLLLNKTDEIFSSPSYDPYFENTNVKVLEPISLNVSSVNTLKYYEKPEKGYSMSNDNTITEKKYIMQKKIDDLEKVSENQNKEINELKSVLKDCLARIAALEGGSKTAKDKSTTPNSLKLTSPKAKEIQLRKSLTSPRTPVKATRLSGTPTRRSTNDLAKKPKFMSSRRPWKPAGGLVLWPIIIKSGMISKEQVITTEKQVQRLSGFWVYVSWLVIVNGDVYINQFINKIVKLTENRSIIERFQSSPDRNH